MKLVTCTSITYVHSYSITTPSHTYRYRNSSCGHRKPEGTISDQSGNRFYVQVSIWNYNHYSKLQQAYSMAKTHTEKRTLPENKIKMENRRWIWDPARIGIYTGRLVLINVCLIDKNQEIVFSGIGSCLTILVTNLSTVAATLHQIFNAKSTNIRENPFLILSFSRIIIFCISYAWSVLYFSLNHRKFVRTLQNFSKLNLLPRETFDWKFMLQPLVMICFSLTANACVWLDPSSNWFIKWAQANAAAVVFFLDIQFINMSFTVQQALQKFHQSLTGRDLDEEIAPIWTR